MYVWWPRRWPLQTSGSGAYVKQESLANDGTAAGIVWATGLFRRKLFYSCSMLKISFCQASNVGSRGTDLAALEGLVADTMIIIVQKRQAEGAGRSRRPSDPPSDRPTGWMGCANAGLSLLGASSVRTCLPLSKRSVWINRNGPY